MKWKYLLKHYVSIEKRTILTLLLTFILVYYLIPSTLAVYSMWQQFEEYHRLNTEGVAFASYSGDGFYQDSLYGDEEWIEVSQYLDKYFSVGKVRGIQYTQGENEESMTSDFVYTYDQTIYNRMSWELAEGSAEFCACSVDKVIPVVVGSGFHEKYQLGDIMNVTFLCDKRGETLVLESKCRITGFLKETGITFLPRGSGEELNIQQIYISNDNLTNAILAGEILDGDGKYLPCSEGMTFLLEMGDYSEREAEEIVSRKAFFSTGEDLEKNTNRYLEEMFGEDIFQALYLLVVSAVCIIGFSYLHYAKKQEMLRLYRRYGMKMKEVLKLSSFHIFIVVTAPTLLGMWTRWHFYEWVSSVNQSDYMQKQSIVGIAMTGIIVLGLMAISILISSWLICRNLKLDLKIIGEDLE